MENFNVTEKPDLSNFKSDIFKQYFSTGELMWEWDYNDDMSEGILKVFYKNGSLAKEVIVSYHEENVNAVEKIYSTKGNLIKEVKYENNLPNGLLREYYPNGMIKVEENFKDGKRHGISRTYNQKGKLLVEDEYYDDHLLKRDVFGYGRVS